MKIDPYRLLSFAFASADLFMEVGEAGEVKFSLGAAQKVCGCSEADLKTRTWRDVVSPADHFMVEAMLAALGPAERRGPVSVRVRRPNGVERHVSLSLGRMPPLKTVSLAFSLAIQDGSNFEGGLLDAEAFAREAERVVERAEGAGLKLSLSLVEMPGLEAARQAMTPDEASRLDQKIVGAIRAQAYAGALVGRLGEESYALVRPDGDTEDQLTARLNQSLGAMAGGIGAVVKPFAATGQQTTNPVLALKRAMDAIARDGAPEGLSLAEAVSRSIETTMAQAEVFKQVVAARTFRLAYQPVVSLKTGLLHHYEVLVRFNNGSPYDTIVMAEELDLIGELDWAVLDESLKIVGARGNKLKLAVNLSGRSIADPAFFVRLRKAVGKVKGAGDSLLFEVTESSKIEDFDRVNAHIQALRGDGHEVCLDDFGAGAASLAYLQRLEVDVVKIDGSYVKTLLEPRERAVVGRVVDMCKDLGVSTIAEMIETDAVADAARQVGFNFGQGYLYGKPAFKPEAVKPRAQPVVARRRGAVESWG